MTIIKDASSMGVSQTFTRYDLYAPNYYSLRRKLEDMGEEGFQHRMTYQKMREVRSLEMENKQQKEFISENELMINAMKVFIPLNVTLPFR